SAPSIQRDCDTFGGSLCTSSGHSSSTNSRISSETSERYFVSSRKQPFEILLDHDMVGDNSRCINTLWFRHSHVFRLCWGWATQLIILFSWETSEIPLSSSTQNQPLFRPTATRPFGYSGPEVRFGSKRENDRGRPWVYVRNAPKADISLKLWRPKAPRHH